MKLRLSNGSSIDLGSTDVETNGTGKTSAIHTSFLSEFSRKLKWNKDRTAANVHIEERMRAYCLDKVRRRIVGRYESYFEPLGGVGVTARIFGAACESSVGLNELDDACLEILKHNFPDAVVYQQDMFKFAWSKKVDADLSFCDFNNYTLLKFEGVYNDVTHKLFAHSKKFVVINDCSNFYLNRGTKSFARYSQILGDNVDCFYGFYLALRDYYKRHFPDWTLRSVDRFYASSYLTFERDNNFMPIGSAGSTYSVPALILAYHESTEEKANPVLSVEI
jgi:hypothetical protein